MERFKNKTGEWTYRIIASDLCEEHHVRGGEWPAIFAYLFPPDNPSKKRGFAEHFGRSLIVFLNTENRLRLLKEAPSMAEEKQTANLLQILYNTGSAVEEQSAPARRKLSDTRWRSTLHPPNDYC